MSSPAEREVLPGVFITDFRRAAPATDNGDDNRTEAEEQAEVERKLKEEDESVSDAVAPSPAAAAGAAAGLTRDVPSAFPMDIPNDVETLELELAALQKNIAQLLKSNAILEEELRATPDDQDFLDAVRENRDVILRRSSRMTQLRTELQLIAPHRLEAINTQLADDIAAQQAAADRERSEAESA